MSAIAENIGTSGTSTFRVAFRVDGMEVSVNQTGLAPGESAMVTKSAKFTLAAGAHVLDVEVDRDNSEAESNEGNNVASIGFNVDAADLVVDGLVASSSPKGSKFGVQLEATVRNAGSAAAGRFSVDFVADSAEVKGNDSTSVSALAVGGATIATVKLTAPAGTYGIQVVLDADDKVLESNNGNNVANFIVTVP